MTPERISVLAKSENAVMRSIDRRRAFRPGGRAVKDYPDAVEDMKRYLAAAAVEGAALSHEKPLAIYPEFVVTANRRLNLLFAMKSGEMYGEEVLAYYYVTWAKAFPDKLDVLGLPYKAAYASALAMSERLQ